MHLLWILASLLVVQPIQSGPALLVPDAATHRAIVDAVGTDRYALESLDIPADPSRAFSLAVNLEGDIIHLDMHPARVRGPGFVVEVCDGDGGLIALPPPPSRTVAGVVRETGARVGGSLLESGLSVIIIDSDKAWSIQPLRQLTGADRSLHVVVSSDDLLLPAGFCPGAVLPGAGLLPIMPRGAPRGELSIAELRAEADYALFTRNGSDLDATVADIENVMEGVNTIYERDVAVSFDLLSVLVRTSEEDDPYTDITDSGELLEAFRGWWNSHQMAEHRDLAHLFTGKSIDGSVIGLAYLGVVCNSPSFAYGLSETRFSFNLARRATLTAHEIGHNFGASHCDGSTQPCHIMCATLGSCDGIGMPNFGPDAIGSIVSHVESASCLDPGTLPPLNIPVADTFPTTSFDNRTWTLIQNATVSPAAVGEPSPPYSALLFNQATLMSGRIDLTEHFDRPLIISFWAQSNDLESTDDLRIEYMVEGGSMHLIREIPAPGGSRITLGPVRLRIPDAALGQIAHVGFITESNSNSDEWFIDNVLIGQAPVPTPALVDDFDGLVLDEWDWPINTGAVINDGSPDAVSPPYVLNLDRNDLVQSRILPAGSVGPNFDVWVSFELQSNHVEPSKSFRLEYRNAGGSWQNVWEYAPASTDRSDFMHVRVPMPDQAEHDDLAIRFRALGTDNDDDWFVDDVAIGAAPAHALPIADDFENADELLSPENWFPIEGPVINHGALAPPSGSAVLNLDFSESISTRAVDLSSTPPGQRLVLRFWLQSLNVETNKSFAVDYRNSDGAWTNAWTRRSTSTDRTTIGFVNIAFPPDALHSSSQIRFRVDGADGTDDWFVDDVLLDTEAGLALPVADSFPTTMLDHLVWSADASVVINSGALNEPSPPYVLNLDKDDFVLSHVIDASHEDDGVVVQFWLQHNGVQPGKHLYVQYLDAGGSLHTAETFTSTGTERVTEGFVNVPLPPDAAHSRLQVRLSVDGASGSDDWFIDDFAVFAFHGLPQPVTDSFLTQRLDPLRWRPVGTIPAINQGALNPPSPPYVLNLDKSELLQTGRIDLSDASVRPTLQFWMQHNGVDAGKSLSIDWLDATSVWRPLHTFVSPSDARSQGLFFDLDLPLAARHDHFALRLSVSGEEPNDDWFLDDVFIGEKAMLHVPFADDFESAPSMGIRNWITSDVAPSSAADNEPSGTFALRFSPGSGATSLPFHLAAASQPKYVRCWVEHTGPSSSDRLLFRYRDAAGTMQTLSRIPANAVNGGSFVMIEAELPPDAFHDDFAIDFLMTPASSGAFFVDDVQLDSDQVSADCPADVNGDGELDFFDLQNFLNLFAAHDPAADVNGDTLFDFFDVQGYLNAFSVGCP